MEGPRLVVSDLDGTLLGNDEALERFAAWCRPRQRDGLRLVYATGRLFESVAAVVKSTPLPEPVAVIGAVGSEIRFFPEGRPAEAWPPCFAPWDADGVRRVMADFAQLQPQPSEFQTPHKLSYYAHDLDIGFLVEVRRRLAMAGHGVEVVYSSRRDLDVLPAGVSKGTATIYLATLWRLTPQEVVVAGDTGNDASMFRRGFRGVIVGNAQPELKALQSPDVYHAARPCAAGVLEGLWHWFGTGQSVP